MASKKKLDKKVGSSKDETKLLIKTKKKLIGNYGDYKTIAEKCSGAAEMSFTSFR